MFTSYHSVTAMESDSHATLLRPRGHLELWSTMNDLKAQGYCLNWISAVRECAETVCAYGVSKVVTGL